MWRQASGVPRACAWPRETTRFTPKLAKILLILQRVTAHAPAFGAPPEIASAMWAPAPSLHLSRESDLQGSLPFFGDADGGRSPSRGHRHQPARSRSHISRAAKARNFLRRHASSVRRSVFRSDFFSSLTGTGGPTRRRPRQVASKLLQRPAAARRQRLVLQPHRLSSHVRPHGRRPLRGEGQRRLDFRTTDEDHPSIRARWWFSPDELYCVIVAPEG
jgi:hypothetical protein